MILFLPSLLFLLFFFFFNDTATTEIYTLSLHDALPICIGDVLGQELRDIGRQRLGPALEALVHGTAQRLVVRQRLADRKSTRLNSSHLVISYAVFCLKKKQIL